ncbi:protein CHLOROPLAST IMPORT APPARATUS 2-like isoform X1 [Prosopis cineraria]|uniref:protein CHLOROPLAST IMPORT APPARATUS 2-like isoform X1 n=1 Tax=Prosopis cineraria TaxID=364024 RepID=UPI0024102945|nr:protein CHLOROPLAST IMPORT APPARATUS 2-like isoform X1 [Prosopis cineraria]
MSSILTGAGGGRTYGFDFDFVKSPSPSIRPSHTSSSSTSSTSSTISESSNSPLAISTRKSRAPRKRPNQTYNEAAALLSTAYPNLFSNKNLKKPGEFSRPSDAAFLDESAEELFLPFRVFDDSASSFLLQQQIQHKSSSLMEPKVVNLQEKSCQSPGEIISRVNLLELDDDCEEDFDAESILDEEMDEGIDSIIGSRTEEDSNDASCHGDRGKNWSVDSSGFGFGSKFDFRLGLVKALRRVDDSNWWNFPAVDIVEISPRINKHTSSFAPPADKEKKKKTTTTKKVAEKTKVKSLRGISIPKSKASKLMLKLNYDDVLSAWSDRGSPFADRSHCSDLPGNDANALAAQIDLVTNIGGVREACVMRYKEKRLARLVSKKIRYQVRKVNADQRPRMKGRFVRRSNYSSNPHR